MRVFLYVLSLIGFTAPADASLRFHVPVEDAADRLYRVVHEGGQFSVYASGEIVEGDAARLRAFLRQHAISDAKIVFDSPGGSLAEGLALGQMIRSLNLDTQVGAEGEVSKAICASACAYAFAGGVNRYYDDTYGRLGVHQFYSNAAGEMKQGDAQIVSGLLVTYLTSMGVDANAFSLATLADAEAMIWLSTSDAESLGFANNGAQETTAEIKTIDMQPYLRLDQVRSRGHARVLLLCGKRGMVMMAGVVASSDEAAFNSSISKRSYIELDGVEALVQGPGNTVVEDDTMWLERGLDSGTLSKLLRAKQLDIWTEGGGAVRWGAMLDLRPVQSKLKTFVADCQGTQR